jgi:peptidoglycan/LPS O-acetylase OafA/YrhL
VTYPRLAREGYRLDIDGLRAIAVAAVIIYHAFPHLLPGGFFGVDVFFVISGFVITRVILAELDGGRFRLREFYRRRVQRIAPALLVVLASSLLVGWYVLLPGEFVWLGRTILWCAGFLANRFFARSANYFDPGADQNPLLHLWSLAVEEQFYLAWPVWILFAFRCRLMRSALWAVTAASLGIALWGAWQAPTTYFYHPLARGWELALGGLVAMRSCDFRAEAPSGRGALAAQLLAVFGLILIVASVRFFHAEHASAGAWGLLPSGGAAALLAAGAGATVNQRLLATRPMVFVGQISYPLYLWHWPLLSFARIVRGAPPPAGLAAGLVLAALLLAYATDRFVERPIRYGKRGAHAVPALLAGLGGIALLGVAAQQVLPARLATPAFIAWEKAATDWNITGVTLRDEIWTVKVPSRRHATVLFIGDSHAQQYWARAQLVLETHPDAARSIALATYTGCPPWPDVTFRRRGRPCTRAFDTAIGQALLPEVDTVVFGAFWEAYLSGEFPEAEAFPLTYPIFSAGDPWHTTLTVESPGTQRALEDFGHVLARLVASGRRVVVVLSNPTSPRFDPLFLLPSGARLALRPPQRLTVARTKERIDATAFEAYVAPLMQKLRETATRNGARVIDPRSSLCDGMSCPTVDASGLPLYLDSNHLRAAYARERATFIDELVLAPGTWPTASVKVWMK